MLGNDVIVSGTKDITGWFQGRVDDGWFTALDVRVDKEEILVIGTLAPPTLAEEGDDDARRAAASARINGFREDTRERRIVIANEAEHLFGKKVSWGAVCDGLERRFTVANVPVMTRLLFDERQVLDTLIDGGIARSRSEALAWCVKLVGANQAEWIDALRTALADVEKVRQEGPNP